MSTIHSIHGKLVPTTVVWMRRPPAYMDTDEVQPFLDIDLEKNPDFTSLQAHPPRSHYPLPFSSLPAPETATAPTPPLPPSALGVFELIALLWMDNASPHIPKPWRRFFIALLTTVLLLPASLVAVLSIGMIIAAGAASALFVLVYASTRGCSSLVATTRRHPRMALSWVLGAACLVAGGFLVWAYVATALAGAVPDAVEAGGVGSGEGVRGGASVTAALAALEATGRTGRA